jgi:hypothetical protein
MDYNQRIEHEAVISARRNTRTWLWWVGNLVYPGSGAAMVGASTGLVVVCVTTIAVSILVWSSEPFGDPWMMSALWEDGTRVLGCGLLLMALSVSLLLLSMGMPRGKKQKMNPSRKRSKSAGGQNGRK